MEIFKIKKLILTGKEMYIPYIIMGVGYILVLVLYTTSCEKVIKTKPKSTPVFSLDKQIRSEFKNR